MNKEQLERALRRLCDQVALLARYPQAADVRATVVEEVEDIRSQLGGPNAEQPNAEKIGPEPRPGEALSAEARKALRDSLRDNLRQFVHNPQELEWAADHVLAVFDLSAAFEIVNGATPLGQPCGSPVEQGAQPPYWGWLEPAGFDRELRSERDAWRERAGWAELRVNQLEAVVRSQRAQYAQWLLEFPLLEFPESPNLTNAQR
jgi:hypothetical protein